MSKDTLKMIPIIPPETNPLQGPQPPASVAQETTEPEEEAASKDAEAPSEAVEESKSEEKPESESTGESPVKIPQSPTLEEPSEDQAPLSPVLGQVQVESEPSSPGRQKEEGEKPAASLQDGTAPAEAQSEPSPSS